MSNSNIELGYEGLMNMDLHEEIQIKGDFSILRVPGGWIYSFYTAVGNDVYDTTCTFVPNGGGL